MTYRNLPTACLAAAFAASPVPVLARGLPDPVPALHQLSTPPPVRAHAALFDAALLTSSVEVGPPAGVEATVARAERLLAYRQGPQAAPPTDPRRADVPAAIASAARATGVPAPYLWRTARRESGLDPSAAAATSSAFGLFQFVEATWLRMVERYGARHGLEPLDLRRPGARRRVLALRADPWVSARMAAELARENAARLQAATRKLPSEGDLYAAHVLGPHGAARLIRASQTAPTTSAATLLPRAAAANRSLFFHAGRPVSCIKLLETLRHG